MNILDVAIILMLLFGAIIGFKRGFLHQLISFVGFLIIIVLSFLLKNSLSQLMYENLPFFSFGGIFKGVTALNILLYEIIAFLIIFSILSIIYKLILTTTKIVEKIFNMTIVLGVISKFLGAIIGFIEYYIIVITILFVISLPLFNLEFVEQSKFKDKILLKTPLISSMTSKSTKAFNDFYALKEKYKESNDAMNFNSDTLCLFLNYDIITEKSANNLLEKGKLKINYANQIIDKCGKGEKTWK